MKNKILKNILKHLILFCNGGLLYLLVELLYREHTHWTMFIVGGLAYIGCGLVNEIFDWDTPLVVQMLYCSIIITVIEFIAGYIINIKLGMNVWDYSNLPFNIMGQICLPFMGLWYLLSFLAILDDDYMRYKFFGEEKPRYKLF